METEVVLNSNIGTYWIWKMPELIGEIPSLFKSAGKAKIIKTDINDRWICIEIKLKQPAKVVDWRKVWGDGLAINSDTYAIIGRRNGVSPCVTELPKNGDKKVTLSIRLELHTFNAEDTVTLENLRTEIRSIAEAVNKTWFYHFK